MKLIKIYYKMDQGFLIENSSKLLRFDDNYNVYISKRALKHFVESRKKEMIETHTDGEIFERLYFAINNVILTYNSYDEIQVKSLNRLIYAKYYTDTRNHNLRLVIDTFFDRFEICSIHFQKRKIPP